MPVARVLFAVPLLLLAAACGDDDPTGGSNGGALEITDSDRGDYDLVIEAHDIDFDADDYEVNAGNVAVGYIEEGDLVHNLVIEDAAERAVPIAGGDDEGKLVVTSRSDAAGTVTLPAGQYTLICTVPGHAAAGMKATLAVG